MSESGRDCQGGSDASDVTGASAHRAAENEHVAEAADAVQTGIGATGPSVVGCGESAAAPVESASQSPNVEIPKGYVPAAESGHDLYQIRLDVFEGPLDLLLFLIRRHRLDVFDIPIAFICEQYLGVLRVMEELSIDAAAEFMYMASELLHIKSKLLLPKPVEVEDQEEEEDPRSELVRRLLEYQKYKEVAEALGGLPRLGREVFARTPQSLERSGPRELTLQEVGVYALVEAFQTVLKRQTHEVRHQVVLEQVSVRKCMHQLVGKLAADVAVSFREALGAHVTRITLVATFLSVLELVRMQLVAVYESQTGELYLKARFSNHDDAMRLVAGLDGTGYGGSSSRTE